VGVELKLPSTSKRVDASFVGEMQMARQQVVLVELKQWETAAPSLYPDNVVVGAKELVHPSVQAASYAEYLRESHSAFTEARIRAQRVRLSTQHDATERRLPTWYTL